MFDRYSFSYIADRPTYEWPNGTRLAVYMALNVEAFEFGLNPGTDFTSMPSAPYHRGYAYRDYGNRVGIARIVRLCDDFDIPLALLINGNVYTQTPRILDVFRARGDEFVGHGRTNSERQIDMVEAEERAMLIEARDTIAHHEGKAPTGWLGPFISQSARTPELLKETGFRYMLDWWYDDQPTWFRTDNGPILAVPYPSMELNDIPAFINRGASDSDFADMAIAAFDEQLADGEHFPSVYCLSLHTFLMGQPHRIAQLRRIFSHIAKQRDRIWLTRPGDIAAHIETLPDDIVTKPEASVAQ